MKLSYILELIDKPDNVGVFDVGICGLGSKWRSHTQKERKWDLVAIDWFSEFGLARKSLSAFKYASHQVFYQASFGLIPVSKSHLELLKISSLK